MKKIVFAVILLLVIIVTTGCTNKAIDTHFAFDEAIIRLPDGAIVKGQVKSWTDFEDGDQLQVTIDGITYLTHASNVVLIDK